MGMSNRMEKRSKRKEDWGRKEDHPVNEPMKKTKE